MRVYVKHKICVYVRQSHYYVVTVFVSAGILCDCHPPIISRTHVPSLGLRLVPPSHTQAELDDVSASLVLKGRQYASASEQLHRLQVRGAANI